MDYHNGTLAMNPPNLPPDNPPSNQGPGPAAGGNGTGDSGHDVYSRSPSGMYNIHSNGKYLHVPKCFKFHIIYTYFIL